MSSSVESIVQLFGDDGDIEGHSCGYCKSPKGAKSWGAWAHQLTCQVYQDLIDRGWRRSGKYCYKPLMHETCCPMYTIRCDASNVALKRSHRRLLKQIAHFLKTGERLSVRKGAVVCPSEDTGELQAAASVMPVDMSVSSSGDVPTTSSSATASRLDNKPKENQVIVREKTAAASDIGESCRLRQGKGRWRRWQRRQQILDERAAREGRPAAVLRQEHAQRLAARRAARQERQTSPTLEQLLQLPIDARHTLEVRHVRSAMPESAAFRDTLDVEHQLYQRYQCVIHGDKPSKCDMQQFTRFLCHSPLVSEGPEQEEYSCRNAGQPIARGSFHQQYWLDGRLIAVGVLDVLSHSVSSVYLFYEPSYSWMQLGTYSALRELAFTRQLARRDPRLHYYYMGYYIHSCKKMRYKGQFSPSYLACPEVYHFIPLELCVPLLDQTKYARLVADPTVKDEDEGSENDALIFVQSRRFVGHPFVPFVEFRSLIPKAARNVRAQIATWATKAGRRVSKNTGVAF